ncbi:MAG: sulfatase-like hydrolase/transferase [Candidatus Sulfomarinibacteraceae bacterium]
MTHLIVGLMVLAVQPSSTMASDGVSPASSKAVDSPSRPDILLVTLDTTRADVLGCYGGDPKVSPNLDRIADRSHVFDRAEASAPQTMPSHTTILSGLHPFNHGVRKNLAVMAGPEVPLIAEELRQAGYSTGAFVSSFVVDDRFGFGRGFDHYDAPDTRPGVGDGLERPAASTVAAAIEWLDGRPSPWFAWVHLFDPHAPYDPPQPFAGRFAGRPYAGEVAYMDNEVGRLVGSMVANGTFDGAVVIIAGDHGEALGEHGEQTHGILLYEATTRVPLLIHLPGQKDAARHRRPVGLVDIAPTVRDLLGIGTEDDGISLLPAMRGDAVATVEPRVLYLESLEGYLRNGWAPLFAVVRGSLKYIDSPRPELYDLDDDPNERKDLAAGSPEVSRKMADWLARIRPAGETFAGETIVLSEDEAAALLAIGYVEGSPGEAAGSRRNPVDAIGLAPIHQQALEAKASGDLEKAASLFARELEQDPESPVLLWYLGSCLTETEPERAEASFRRAMDLRPDFEAPVIALAEMLLQRAEFAAAVAVASDGIDRTFDAGGRLHFLRAAARDASGGDVAAVMTDLGIAIDRAARPGAAYRLRAAVRLQRLDDDAGALDDLDAFVEWSVPADVAMLADDPRFEKLRGDPRFSALVVTNDSENDPR